MEHTRIEDIGFRIYTEDEIRRISRVEVTNDEAFNELGHIIPCGLYDLRMGECYLSGLKLTWSSRKCSHQNNVTIDTFWINIRHELAVCTGKITYLFCILFCSVYCMIVVEQREALVRVSCLYCPSFTSFLSPSRSIAGQDQGFMWDVREDELSLSRPLRTH